MRRRDAPAPLAPNTGEVDLFALPDTPPLPPPTTLPDVRLTRLFLVALSALALLFFQGFRLQVASGSLFRGAAEENRVRAITDYAPRGIFLDRFGTPLVQNVPAVDLVAEPGFLPDDREELLRTLREALPSRPLDDLRDRVLRLRSEVGSPVTLLQGLTHQEFLAVTSRSDRLRGLRTETTAVRAYRGEGAFAHVLGYTGKLGPEERSSYETYLLTESVGKTGLEREYEAVLRGTHGARRAEVDATGSIQHDLGRSPSVPGNSLRLHLDAGLQETVARALAAGAKRAVSRRAAAVALDPYSGGVLSLVSLPTFPHSAIAQGTDPDEVRRALADPSSPLLNRVTQGQYVPGSSFKPVVAAAALEEGVITPTSTVESAGGIRVGPWFFPDWKSGGHGRTDLTKALAESVNTYFYLVGGGLRERVGLGLDRLTAWARTFGFGARTGIDLPEEATGFLPSKEWKERVKGEPWYIGDTYHAAIGQGDVLVTPLQLAVAAATIANGGTVITPRLVDATLRADGTIRERVPPLIRAERVARAETTASVRSALRAAVTAGSAQRLADLPVAVAAKTGTAQIGGKTSTHAWVTVLAPLERPEMVLVVLVEEGGGGDRVAVPIAHEILSWYFSPPVSAARRRGQALLTKPTDQLLDDAPSRP